jgi:hypothetical protein
MPQMRGVMERHFKEHAPFAEFFKTAEFVDVQIGVIDQAIILHDEW